MSELVTTWLKVSVPTDVRSAALLVGVSVRTIRRRCQAGEYGARQTRPGGHWHLRVDGYIPCTMPGDDGGAEPTVPPTEDAQAKLREDFERKHSGARNSRAI
jgi:hypothetical protein